MVSLPVFTRWTYATILFSAFFTAPPDSRASDFPPQIPECHGHDLLADLKTNKPEVYDSWVKSGRETPNGEAILWRIDGNGLSEPSWLFATAHVTDPRVLNIPVEAQAAFFKARTLAVEIKNLDNRWVDNFNNFFALPLIYLPDGKTWDQYLTKSDVDLVEARLHAYGYTVSDLGRMQPWAALLYSLLYPNCEAWRVNLGLDYLDAELANWARQAGKPVIGLQTRYEAAKDLAAIPLESQFKAMLIFAKATRTPEDEQETSIQIYLTRQLGLYFALEHSPYGVGPDDLSALKEFWHHALEIRNLTMRDRSLPLILKGGAFIAVGAGHLPGDQGLVELFRKAGYEVTPVN